MRCLLFVALSSLLVSAAPAATPMGSHALEITGCSLEYRLQSAVADKVLIAFINLNKLPVTQVMFRRQAGTTAFTVMDMGSFRPGVKLHHRLNPPVTQVGLLQSVSRGRNVTCSVNAYTLSDGRTWISDRLRKDLGQ